jgi:hypothetical protein
MTEPDDDETEPARLADVVRTNTPGLVGGATANVLQQAGVGPLLSWTLGVGVELAGRLDDINGRARYGRAGETLQLAAEQITGGIEELERLATADDWRNELAARVMRAAATTPLPEKLPALADVLVRGLQRGAHDPQALVLAGALDDLEAPHVELLKTLANARPDNPSEDPNDKRDPFSWSEHEMREALPLSADVLPALLAACVRHGLVEQRIDAYAGAPSGWRMTDVGRTCLDLLKISY